MNFMTDYESRLKNAIEQASNIEGDKWDKAHVLWKSGVSLRIIEEITGISRSKLQRFFAENNLKRVSDIRTQNREQRVQQCNRLHKMGFNRDEIAETMHINKRTVDAYFKQLGINSKTNFGDD